MNEIKKITKQENFFLIFLFIFSFFIRFLFFIFFLQEGKKSWVCRDSAEYHSIGVNISRGNGILTGDGELNYRRLPGYPIFLGTCYKIFKSEDVKNALWFQVFLSSLIPILIFFLSLALFPGNLLLAKISALYFSLHVGFVLYSGMLLSESLFTLFFLLFCILFFKRKYLFFCDAKSSLNYKIIFFAGIILGIVSLIRPVGHYLLFLCLVLLLFSNFHLKEKFKSSRVLFVGWLLIVGWWLLRNFIFTGYIFFHTLPGIHFLIYSAAYVDSEKCKCEYVQSKDKLVKQWEQSIAQGEEKTHRKLNDIECCKIAEQISLDYIKSNPVFFAKHSLIHIFKTGFGIHSSSLVFLNSGEWVNYDKNTTMWHKIKRMLLPKTSNKFVIFLVYLELLFLFLMYLGFLGFIVGAFHNRENLCLLLKILPFVFLFLFITLAYGCARLRLPIEPFLILLSFSFWLSLFKKEEIGFKRE